MKKLFVIPFLLIAMSAFSQSNTDSTIIKRTCPKCKSHKQVIPIVYGRPSIELSNKAKDGKCRLGGCVVSNNSPRNYCKKDQHSF
jgi:hypothetical protein